MKRIPLIMQMNTAENSAATLSMILAHNRKYVPLDEVREQCISSRSVTDVPTFCKAAEHFGLEARSFSNVAAEDLKKMDCPLVAQWNKHYYVVICGFSGKNVKLNDPSRGSYSMSLEAFMGRFSGNAIQLKPSDDFVPEGKRKSLLDILKNRMKGNKSVILRTVTYRALSTATTIFTVLLTGHIVDDVMGKDDRQYMFWILLLLIALILIKVYFMVYETLYVMKESRLMAARSGSALFKTMLRQPMKFYDDHYSGDLVNRVETNTNLDQSFLRTIIPRLIDCAVTIVYMILMFICNYVIATMFLVLETIYLIVTVILRRRTTTILRSISVAESNANSKTLHGVNMMETIKSSGMEQAYFKSWREIQDTYDDGKYRMIRLNSESALVTNIHTILTSALLLFAGAALIIKGSFSMGLLTVFMSLTRSMQTNLNQTIQIFNDLQLTRNNIERVDDILSREIESEVELGEETPWKLKGEISLKNVSFAYSMNDTPVIKNYNLEIARGERVALVGKTGCGKSTILKIVTGLYKPTDGNIYYDGKPLDEIPAAIVHTSIASVDQDTVMYVDSVGNNIKFWDTCIEDYEMVLAARDADIHSVIAEKHGGYDTKIVENGRNYSGGELQRIELARALAVEPTILVLDEFTAALDAITEEKVFKSIMNRGITCIMAAHRLSTVMLCDRVIVMDHGEIVEQGTPDELYKLGGHFTQLMENA